jgi:hypothetical protein
MYVMGGPGFIRPLHCDLHDLLGTYLLGKLPEQDDHTFASNAEIKKGGALPELHTRHRGMLLNVRNLRAGQ